MVILVQSRYNRLTCSLNFRDIGNGRSGTVPAVNGGKRLLRVLALQGTFKLRSRRVHSYWAGTTPDPCPFPPGPGIPKLCLTHATPPLSPCSHVTTGQTSFLESQSTNQISVLMNRSSVQSVFFGELSRCTWNECLAMYGPCRLVQRIQGNRARLTCSKYRCYALR